MSELRDRPKRHIRQRQQDRNCQPEMKCYQPIRSLTHRWSGQNYGIFSLC